MTAGALAAAAALMVANPPARAADSCLADQVSMTRPDCLPEPIIQLDRDVDQALERAMSRMSAAGRVALKADHALYEQIRITGLSATDFHLPVQMEMRRDFLLAIREPRGKWLGDWANSTGSIHIARNPKGGFVVHASAAEPTLGHWRCEFDDSALLIDGGLTVGLASAALTHGGPNEGWTLTLRLDGDVMSVTETAPSGETGRPPFCTGEGRLAGAYFAQEQLRKEQPRPEQVRDVGAMVKR